MKVRTIGVLVAVAVAVLLVNPFAASAIIINRTFVTSGNIGNSGVTATAAPVTDGGGTLPQIFNFAADLWQNAILDNWTVNLVFGWGATTGNTLAFHTLTTQGGTPNRETSGAIVFRSNAFNNQWFADSTPGNNSEWTTFSEQFMDLGGGSMNVARVFSGATGDAVNHFDLFSVALHEIGHALGLSAANTAYRNETQPDNAINVTGPRPFAGSVIPTNNTGIGPGTQFNAHLNPNTFSNALMVPAIGRGTRRLISDVDILANCQVSQCLEPVVVPEPSTVTLMLLGPAVYILGRRLVRRRRG